MLASQYAIPNRDRSKTARVLSSYVTSAFLTPPLLSITIILCDSDIQMENKYDNYTSDHEYGLNSSKNYRISNSEE